MGTLTSLGFNILTRYDGRGAHEAARSMTELEARGKGFGGAMKAAAVGVGLVGLAAVATGAEALKMATGFQASMTKIQTQAGGSAKDVKELSNQVLSLGGKVQQAPKELADSLYHLKSVGMDNVDAMKALKTSSDLAAVGGADLESTTNALAGAWRTGIKGAETFSKTAGTVNAVIGAGNMRMEDFTSAIGTGILPAAKTFGLSLNQVGAALALFTDEGVPATDAATRLRMSFSLLGAPSDKADKVLKSIGLSGTKLANAMRSKAGLIGAIQLLSDHLKGSGKNATEQAQILSHAFGGGRSSGAIMSMVNNLDVLKQKQEQVNKSVGKYPAAVVAQRKTAEAQLKLLKSGIETAMVKLGTVLLPPFVKLLTWINSTLFPGITKVKNSIVGMIPVDAISTALGKAKKAASGFMGLFTGKAQKKQAALPISFGAVAGPDLDKSYPAKLAAQLKGAFNTAKNAVKTQVSTLMSSVKNTVTSLAGPLKSQLGALAGNLASVLGTIINNGKVVLSGLASNLGKAFNIVATVIVKDILPSLNNLIHFLSPILGLVKPLAIVVKDVLAVALSVVGAILKNVLGPALRGVTGFLSSNRTAILSVVTILGVFSTVLLIAKADQLVMTAAMKAQAATSAIVAAKTKILAIAQGILNAVMDANPFAIVVIALIALAAGFVYAWKHSETFRNIFIAIWNGIKSVTATVFRFLTHGLGTLVFAIMGPVGVLIVLALNWKTIWGALVSFFVNIVWKNGIKPIISALNAGVKGIGAGFSFLWNSVLKPVFRFIVNAWLNVTGAIIHGAAAALGWVPGVGGKLKKAAKAFDTFKNDVNRSLDGVKNKKVSVPVVFHTSGGEKFQATGGPVFGPGTGTSDSIPTMLSAGEHVVTAKEVQNAGGHGAIMAQRAQWAHMAKGGIVGYASGGGVNVNVTTPSYGTINSKIQSAIHDLVQKNAKSIFESMIPDPGASPGSGVTRWSNVVLTALSLLHQSAGWLKTVLRRMNQESGGNPTIVNRWDSNWKAGHPSVGLMQVIGPTFRSNAGRFRNTGPFLYGTSVNPLANVYAGLNYAIHRYGSLSALNRPGGYANGTSGASAGWHSVGERGPEWVKFRGGERVMPHGRMDGGGASEYHLDMRGAVIGMNQRQFEDMVVGALSKAETKGRIKRGTTKR